MPPAAPPPEVIPSSASRSAVTHSWSLEVGDELLAGRAREDGDQLPAVLAPVVEDLLGRMRQQRDGGVLPTVSPWAELIGQRYGASALGAVAWLACTRAYLSDRVDSAGRRAWPARLHVVTGKGGTGKTTVAAALALALAAGGRRRCWSRSRGARASRSCSTAAAALEEGKIATADGGGEVRALAMDVEAALLEYLEMFYNLGLAGRALRRMGAVEFATTIAPGLRDVLLTGKVKESVTRAEKGKRRSTTRGAGRAADGPHREVPRRHQGGVGAGQGRPDALPGRGRGEGAALRPDRHPPGHPARGDAGAGDAGSDRRAPERACRSARDRQPQHPAYLPADDLAKAAEGDIDADAVRAGLDERRNHIVRQRLCRTAHRDDPACERSRRVPKRRATRRDRRARLELPQLPDGVDLGGLYELAEALDQQGVR